MQRRLVVRADEVAADDFSGAIRQDETAVVAEEGVAQRRLDADARRPADEDQVLDLALPEDVVELRLEEPAVALLRDNEIPGLRRQLRDDVCVPRPFDQEVAGA